MSLSGKPYFETPRNRELPYRVTRALLGRETGMSSSYQIGVCIDGVFVGGPERRKIVHLLAMPRPKHARGFHPCYEGLPVFSVHESVT